MGRRAVAAAVFTLVALLAVPASAARAQDGGWRIERFAADITVEPDGSVRVVENVDVDFNNLERHGIFRVIPVKYDLAENTEFEIPDGQRAQDFQRTISIEDIEVESTAPADVELEGAGLTGRLLRIRIGDEDLSVTGRQTYRISYIVRGALNDFEAHGELYWNATGTEWEVPIERAVATVRAPAIRDATCFRGTVGATALCERSQVDRRSATFVARGLQPGEGLTVVTGFPRDAVDVPPPQIEERWTLTRALMGSPFAIPAAAVVLLAGLGLVFFLAYRQGRDRITRDRRVVESESDAPAQRRALFAPRVTPVEFRPPVDLRPGQMGLLVDERVDPVDVSATIVDLAVRGHLRITEVEDPGSWRRRTDWVLERLEAPDDTLLPYEQRLLNGLFKDGPSVQMSELKGHFSADYQDVSGQLYTDAVERKWFPRRPDSVRTKWLAIGVMVTLLAAGVFAAAMYFTTWALAVAPLILVGLVLTVSHRWMPHRTAAGSRLLDQVLGFRQFIVRADAGRAEYAEQQHLFIPYLPYAIVFGAVDRWARTFAELGAVPAAGAAGVGFWYVGAGPFDARSFSSGLSEFSTSIGAALPTAPPSSSGSSGFSGGGFSGGGFGGGGGGSW